MTGAADNGATLLDSKKKLISKTYLRNAWYVAAWSDDLVDGQLLARTIMKEPVVLYRKADGNVAAILDRCSHRFAPLHMGKIVHGDRIQCPYHGLEFDASGACVLIRTAPRTSPRALACAAFPCRKHKAIWIRMGESRPTCPRCRTSACSTTFRSCTPPSATR